MKKYINSVIATVMFYASSTYAALPTAVTSTNADKGDYIAMGRELSKSGIELVAQLIGAGILIAVAAAGIKSFWDVRKGKAEWTDLTGVVVGGLAVAAFGLVLLTQAEKIL
ncbi:hypothetical protein VTH8203_00845 [Vibrio thalassae]|uniref:TrbC/VIRB2 family protein n=1 Tax=Vibrio thalassae TaxID=1243014 RepID=A0A240EEY7_9VIBR|nr:TIGR03745 family integrating conjugative element membrane protein [Vibrio thalassae]SNX47244.1 hypothetical protein VTH8203_00845 [Vibrio thalassae]